MINSENSVISASVQLFCDLLRSCLTDFSQQLCSNWESQEKDSVGVKMMLLSLTVPLFAFILYVCTFFNTSWLGNTIAASSSESSQNVDAIINVVAIIRLLHLHIQICKTSWGSATFVYDTFQKQKQLIKGVPIQAQAHFCGCKYPSHVFLLMLLHKYKCICNKVKYPTS